MKPEDSNDVNDAPNVASSGAGSAQFAMRGVSSTNAIEVATSGWWKTD